MCLTCPSSRESVPLVHVMAKKHNISFEWKKSRNDVHNGDIFEFLFYCYIVEQLFQWFFFLSCSPFFLEFTLSIIIENCSHFYFWKWNLTDFRLVNLKSFFRSNCAPIQHACVKTPSASITERKWVLVKWSFFDR